MGVLKSVASNVTKISLVLLLVALFPGLPPNVEFEAFSIAPSVKLEGQLAVNSRLNGAERLFEGIIHGPEDLKVYDGQLYMTLFGGYIMRIAGDKLENVTKLGLPCAVLPALYEEVKCGRPLGMHFDKDGRLYVADPYYGLFKVDIKTGQYEHLISTNDTIEGRRPMIPNSVTMDDDGVVYWTDSSTSHNLHDAVFTMLSNGNGRLLKYDPETKRNSVLMNNINFANGVVVSADGSYLIISETINFRLLKYHLKGPKAGQSEVWVDGLVGNPDNIYRDSNGTYVVALYQCRDDMDLFAKLAQQPFIRKLLFRFLQGVEAVFSFLRDVYPSPNLKTYSHLVGHLKSIPKMSDRVVVLFLNDEGEVVRSLYGTDGISGISSFVEFEGYYYLGSPVNPFLARVKANN